MAETIEQYVARILGFVGDRDPLEILHSSPRRLEALIDGRTRYELARKPDSGKWSVVEVLAHLADSEIVGAWRFRSILAANGTALQAYDQNAWAATFRYTDTDPFESQRLFETTRASNLALLKRVDTSLHGNYGMHAERGRESVQHLMRLYAGHDLNHIGQIEKLLRS